MLGLIFGRRLLAGVIEAVPVLEPLALPLTIVYVLFVWMTWTAPSLFNLVLRLDPFGRLVLNASERLESTLVGVCLVLCLLVESTVFYFHRDLAFVPLRTGMLYLGLMLPLIATFRQRDGLQKALAAYTAGVAFCVLMATFQSLSFCWQVTGLGDGANLSAENVAALRSLSASALQWFEYSSIGIVLSTWIGAGLSLNPGRR